MSSEYGTIIASEIRIKCLICGESQTFEEPYPGMPIVCKKCKAAVMKVRKEMENSDA